MSARVKAVLTQLAFRQVEVELTPEQARVLAARAGPAYDALVAKLWDDLSEDLAAQSFEPGPMALEDTESGVTGPEDGFEAFFGDEGHRWTS